MIQDTNCQSALILGTKVSPKAYFWRVRVIVVLRLPVFHLLFLPDLLLLICDAKFLMSMSEHVSSLGLIFCATHGCYAFIIGPILLVVYQGGDARSWYYLVRSSGYHWRVNYNCSYGVTLDTLKDQNSCRTTMIMLERLPVHWCATCELCSHFVSNDNLWP